MSDTQRIAGVFDETCAEERADRALATMLAPEHPTLTRSKLKQLIEDGRVRIAGATLVEPSRRVKPGQDFELDVPPPSDGGLAAQAIPLVIIHEDVDLLVIDKPVGLVVHPAAGNPDNTLVNALLAHCGPELLRVGNVGRPGIVHRLDKDTTGLMVVAKSERAMHSLARQFAAHSVDRAYRALVWGVPSPAAGTIDAAIGRSRGDRRRMTTRASGGKPALTRYRVLETLLDGALALIECRLATGRTHQIRVHLAAIGHALIGDPTYGRARGRRRVIPETARSLLDAFPRQALDAVELGFEHPESGKRVLFRKNLSSDFKSLIDHLEVIGEK
jgi:23S rRNA pseudouridine1911/1915/1917 synthase